jgi:protein-tyrosine-phosphatase
MQNILVLCTGNSARSILAEIILNQLGEGRVRAFSAGSQPTGVVNPNAVVILKMLGYDAVVKARSKSWDEFTGPDAPKFDLVVTLCDQAAGEVCPVWNGAPLQIHWGFPDPAAEPSDQARMAFMDVYEQIHSFASVLIDTPLAGHDATSLHQALAARLPAGI